MKLYFSSNSPYARKVRVLLLERGLHTKCDMVEVDTSDLTGPLLKVNPLGRVPVLDAGEDGIIHDSPVICEYLDGYTSGLKREGKVIDLRDKCLAAVAQGMLDAGYAVRMEKMRPEALQWQAWKDKQFGKIERTLDELEEKSNELPAQASIGAIGLACALEWIEFRHPEGNWLVNRPRLKAWAETFSQRPSMQQTRPA
jgi:glutathione S-transferase